MMTWGKAAPVLVISAIFDAVRFMFEWFIFFGPALAAVACTVAGSNTAIGSAVGTLAVGTVCTAAAGVAGFFGIEVIGPFGIIMAMATGLAGWLTVGLILIMFNGRIFKENALGFAASLLVSEIPFVGSIPAITIAVWRMYHHQIKLEKAALEKYEKEQTATRLQQRNQQTAELMQARSAQLAQDGIY